MHVCAFVCCPDNFSNSHEGSNSGQGGKERRTNKHDQQFIQPKILNAKVFLLGTGTSEDGGTTQK